MNPGPKKSKRIGVLIRTGNNGLVSEIEVEDKFILNSERCQVPTMLGVPLAVSINGRGKETCNRASRLMIDRVSGFAPFEWSIGSKDSYDIIAFRTDGKDFTLAAYKQLADYITYILD